MKYSLFILSFLLAHTAIPQSNPRFFIYKPNVDSLVKWVKNKEVKKITNKVIYPLNRKYPLPDIKTQNDFIAYYDTIFDDSLSTILTSATSEENWVYMKDKGVKLNSGIIWFSHDIDFSVINYMSKAEIIKRQQLIQNDRNNVHTSLRGFIEPVMKIKTPRHIIRIDRMNNNRFRYSAWTLDDSTSNKPKFIINQGLEIQSHSELCPFYKFKLNELTYNVYAGCPVSGYGYKNMTPEQTGYISIEQNNREIKKESIIQLKR